MKTGSVKWFNPSKGYGFITPDGGGKDIFVHISALETSGIKNLSENQKVSYDEARNKDRISAGNIKLIQCLNEMLLIKLNKSESDLFNQLI